MHDEVIEALYTSVEMLAAAEPERGWARREASAILGVSGRPVPTMNGVFAGSAEIGSATVAGLLDEVAGQGLPYCLQFPDGAEPLSALAEAKGLQRDDDVPVMRLDRLPAALVPADLRVRRLPSGEALTHADVAARGFGAPLDVFGEVAVAATRVPGVAFYVGEVDDGAVTTGLGLRVGDWVAVFNVATPPEHRRRGYGAGITARIVQDAFQQGASWAWLQSSPDGRGVYEKLGFSVVALWQCWIHS